MPRTRPSHFRRARRQRRGVETLEVLVALPILIIATLAIIQFGVMLLVQQAVTQAATVGAREAAKGANVTAVAQEVTNVLQGTHGIGISNVAGSGAKVALETTDGAAVVTTTQFGDPGLTCSPPSITLGANEVRVTVCVALTKSPLLNLLATFGFNVTGKRMELSSLAKQEL